MKDVRTREGRERALIARGRRYGTDRWGRRSVRVERRPGRSGGAEKYAVEAEHHLGRDDEVRLADRVDLRRDEPYDPLKGRCAVLWRGPRIPVRWSGRPRPTRARQRLGPAGDGPRVARLGASLFRPGRARRSRQASRAGRPGHGPGSTPRREIRQRGVSCDGETPSARAEPWFWLPGGRRELNCSSRRDALATPSTICA